MRLPGPRYCLIAAALLGAACDEAPPRGASASEPATAVAHAGDTEPEAVAPAATIDDHEGQDHEDETPERPVADAPPPAPETPPPTIPKVEPIETRRADRALMVFVAPDKGSEFRGKIPHGEPFSVLEFVDGPGCRKPGWGRVREAGFVCLHHTTKTKAQPRVLPRVARGRTAPFFYAELRPKRGADEHPPAPRWRHRSAMRAGDDPVDTLEPDHSYAFARRRRSRGGAVLIDNKRRAVREPDVRRLKPGPFSGRDLEADPIPAGVSLAWTIDWPNVPLLEAPRADAKIVGKLGYHVELFVDPEPIIHRREAYFRLAEEPERYIPGGSMRRWIPAPALEGMGPDEIWLDVEVEQQTLAVMRGPTAVFVTMVSTGNYKHPTPRGIYRIHNKQAYDDMRSRSDEDEPYWVEKVPWVQYFDARYALHGTYWHNRFGRRTSHGCINLSARDAARVYGVTAPEVEPGWISIYEHEQDLGTVVRIRSGDKPVVDKREG